MSKKYVSPSPFNRDNVNVIQIVHERLVPSHFPKYFEIQKALKGKKKKKKKKKQIENSFNKVNYKNI